MTDQQPVTETPPMAIDITALPDPLAGRPVSAMDLLGIAPDAELNFARGAEVDGLRERLAQAERERDSLARRCAARFEDSEKLRAERDILAQQLDDARALNACEVGEWNRVVAERDALRPVFAAVGDLLDAGHALDEADADTGDWKAYEQERDRAWGVMVAALIAAVDRLAAASPPTATQAGERGAAVGQDGAEAQKGAEGVSVVP